VGADEYFAGLRNRKRQLVLGVLMVAFLAVVVVVLFIVQNRLDTTVRDSAPTWARVVVLAAQVRAVLVLLCAILGVAVAVLVAQIRRATLGHVAMELRDRVEALEARSPPQAAAGSGQRKSAADTPHQDDGHNDG
jgi:cell division protein FtsW (lipid II flippase)